MRPVSTQRRVQPHAIQSEQKQTSEAANPHYTIIDPDPHFSLKHFLMTEQTNLNIFSVWLSGGRLVIIYLSCYSMSGLGVGVGREIQMKEGEGLVGFFWKHKWHGPGDTVRQIALFLSVCIRQGPWNVSLNKERGLWGDVCAAFVAPPHTERRTLPTRPYASLISYATPAPNPS